jgi:dTDP-4-amino-4,6-dideoxygalactose transaminase
MNAAGINPRRYFFPSLDTIEYVQPKGLQTFSRDVASRVMCLPLYPELSAYHQNEVISKMRDLS